VIPTRLRRQVLAVAVLATSMTFIDATALNQALPAIGKWFGATASQSLWIIGAYNVLLAITLLPVGMMADRLGRSRVLACGIMVFAFASVICAASPNVVTLIVGRGIQGMGGAMMLTGSLAVLVAATAPDQSGRTIGVWSAWCAVATIVGPLMGGSFAEAGWWQAIFWINLPLAAVTMLLLIVMGRSLQPDSADPIPRKLSSTITESLSIGRSTTVRSALGLTVLLDTAFYGLLLVAPLALIKGVGYRADQAAAAQLPVLLALIVTCPFAGRWHDRKGPRPMVCCGALLAMAGLTWIAAFGLGMSPGDFIKHLLLPFVLIGVGMGLGIVGLSTTVMNGVGKELLGAGAAANALVARMAAAFAVGTFGCVLLWHAVDMQTLTIDEVHWRQPLRHSMWLASAICAAVFFGAATTLRVQPSEPVADPSCTRGGGLPS